MAITILNRFEGGSLNDVSAVAKKAAPMLVKAGAEYARLSRIHTGPHAGQWATAIRYKDWETYGRVTQALSADAEYQKVMAEVAAVTKLCERTILVGIDL